MFGYLSAIIKISQVMTALKVTVEKSTVDGTQMVEPELMLTAISKSSLCVEISTTSHWQQSTGIGKFQITLS